MDLPESVEIADSSFPINCSQRENFSSTSPAKLGAERGQISFTSISSSESGFDLTSTSAKVETAPLRIQRMALLDSDYVGQRKASVECLLSSIPSEQVVARPSTPSTESTNAKHQTGSPSRLDVHASSRLSDLPTFATGPSFQFSAALRNSSINESNTEFSAALEEDGASDVVSRENLGQVVDVVDSAPIRQDKTSLKLMKANDSKNTSECCEEEETVKCCEERTLTTPPKQSVSQMLSEQANKPRSDKRSVSRCSVFCSLFHFNLDKYSIVDVLLTLFSLGMFLFDLVTDCLLAFSYYLQKEDDEQFAFFFWITLAFIVIPSVIVQLFSLWWMFDDYRKIKDLRKKMEPSSSVTCGACLKCFLSLVGHCFQLAPLVRYIRATCYGVKSRYYYLKKNEEMEKHFENSYKYEMHDVSMLRLLESFLESAPQLVLQIYIMLRLKQAPILTVISCVASLVSLASVMVSFQRAIRNSNPKKSKLSIFSCVIMFCWRACTTAARVLAFALFLTVQPLAFLVFVLIHWLIVSFFIAVKGTEFCPTKLTEYLFDMVCGLIHVFCFLNVHENNNSKTPSRSLCRMLIFYVLVFSENSVFAIMWYFRPGAPTDDDWKNVIFGGMWNGKNTVMPDASEQKATPSLNPVTDVMPQSYSLAFLIAVHGLFFLGMVFMMFYYIAVHPSRRSCSRQPHRDKDMFELVSAPAQSKPDQSYNKRSEFIRRSGPELLEDENPLLGKSGDSAPQAPIERSSKERLASSSSERRCEATETLQQDLLVRRDSQSHTFVSDESCSSPKWITTLFNRDKRAKVLYTKRYSIEKYLEDDENILQSLCQTQDETYTDPRQTDRFESTVTPKVEKKCMKAPKGPNKDAEEISPRRFNEACSVASGSHRESIVIRPGSQQSLAFINPGKATRSATHHGPLSSTLSSPSRKPRPLMPATLANRSQQRLPSVPQPVQSRDYSASMSCLMGKNQPYIARRGLVLGKNVPRLPSFSICRNEILEAIESSV